MKLKVKGINDGLLLTLPNLSWEECRDALWETIGENVGFYAGANLFLDAGNLDVRVIEITSLRSELEKQGIFLKGIFGQSEKTRQNCRSLGLITETVVSKRSLKKEIIEEKQSSKEIGEKAYLINRTVRSGTVIEKKESIIVIGDINPGGEIVSDNNVIIFGTVRGRVTAGKTSESDAYIEALNFDNAQVMINGVMTVIEKTEHIANASGLIMVRNKFGEIKIESK